MDGAGVGAVGWVDVWGFIGWPFGFCDWTVTYPVVDSTPVLRLALGHKKTEVEDVGWDIETIHIASSISSGTKGLTGLM